MNTLHLILDFLRMPPVWAALLIAFAILAVTMTLAFFFRHPGWAKSAREVRALALCAVLFLPSISNAAAVPEAGAPKSVAVSAPEPSPFAAGTVTLSPFASYRVHEFGQFNGKFGGGLALSYFAADNFAVEVETLSEHLDDSHWADAFTEAGVNFKGYLPLGATGLAPYILIGYTRNLHIDENRFNAGAGIAYHISKNTQLFADGRWTHDFSTLGHALFRVGGGVSF